MDCVWFIIPGLLTRDRNLNLLGTGGLAMEEAAAALVDEDGMVTADLGIEIKHVKRAPEAGTWLYDSGLSRNGSWFRSNLP